MVQPDSVVIASATIIVGIAFLVNLVQAQGRTIKTGFLGLVVVDILLFISAIIEAVREDLIPAVPHQEKIWTWNLFYASLFLLAVLVCLLPTHYAAVMESKSMSCASSLSINEERVR